METSSCFINEISVMYSKKLFTSKAIKTSADAHLIAREIFEHTSSQIELKEYFFIILLNRANEVIAFHKLSEGGICGTVVDIRLAFATALKSLATGIILLHNHPSGNLTASQQDIATTKNFVAGGKLLELTVYDHLILTASAYYSFADEGILT